MDLICCSSGSQQLSTRLTRHSITQYNSARFELCFLSDLIFILQRHTCRKKRFLNQLVELARVLLVFDYRRGY